MHSDAYKRGSSAIFCLLISSCTASPTNESAADPTDTEINMAAVEDEEPVDIVENAPYRIEGLFDRLDQNRVWIFSSKGIDFAEVADPSEFSHFEDGDPIAFACFDAGLVEVGTNSYTRRATQYSGCSLFEPEGISDTPTSDYSNLADLKEQMDMEQSLRAMAEQ